MPIACIIEPRNRKRRVGSFRACQRYMAGENDERGVHRFSQGVASFRTAAVEMEAAADLSRCRDPVCHWLVTYRSDEPSTIAMVESDVARLLTAIDLGDHQFIAIVHDDTPQRHVHVMANKVGPDGRAARMSWCRRESERDMAVIAIKRGVPVVPGHHNQDLVALQNAADPIPGKRGAAPAYRLNERDRRRLEQRGILPWSEFARPLVLAAARAAEGWSQFETALAGDGIVIKRVIRRSPRTKQLLEGLAFCEGEGERAPGCKASAICASVRYGSLVARWGEFPTRGYRGELLGERQERPRTPSRRSPAGGREAARQRRAVATGSVLAMVPLRRLAGKERVLAKKLRPAPGAAKETSASPPDVELTAHAEMLVQELVAGFSARRHRSSRRKRMMQWAFAQGQRDAVMAHGGRVQLPDGATELRPAVEQQAARCAGPVDPVLEHFGLKRQYDAYRSDRKQALKREREKRLADDWSGERVRRACEREAMDKRFAAKKAVALLYFAPGTFRWLWLRLLQLRKKLKLQQLAANQRERWRERRSRLWPQQQNVSVLGYREWLRTRAVECPVAARQDQWIGSLEQRRNQFERDGRRGDEDASMSTHRNDGVSAVWDPEEADRPMRLPDIEPETAAEHLARLSRRPTRKPNGRSGGIER